MKVIVLGAGVIGVTTAYYLAKHGAEVRVLDRQPGPGMETSFANAGELSYGMTSPWAAPGVPMKAVKWLFMRHRPLFIWPLLSLRMWSWGIQMLMNCNETAYRRNKGRMVRIYFTGWVTKTQVMFDYRDAHTGPLAFRLGEGTSVKGLEYGIYGMRVGGQRRLIVPPRLGHGSHPTTLVPANSQLTYDVELVSVAKPGV